MAENTTPQNQDQVKAADEEARFKQRLKDEYGIEDDASSFKEKRDRWQKAEAEIPQYQSTFNALVEHARSLEEAAAAKPVRQVAQSSEEEEEERLRTIAKLDPYEGTKRMLAKWEQKLDEKFKQVQENTREVAQGTTLARETMRRSKEIVEQNWPEALDKTTELFKMGHQIFNREMSPQEQQDPRSFLIATERAAGRLGIAPKSKRRANTKTSDVRAQNVSRSGTAAPDESDDEKPLSARQKKIIQGIGVDEKTYRLAIKNRKEQRKKSEDDD